MQAPSPLELGQGLRAAPAQRADAPALVDLVARNRAAIARYLWRAAQMLTVEHIDAHFDDVDAQQREGRLLDWHLFQDDVLCGTLRLNYIEPENAKACVAYFLDQAFQGRGLMTRALRGVIAHAFDALGFHRLELRHARGNEGSRRVAEKAGFVLEGILRQTERVDGVLVDALIYGLLRPEWQPQHAHGEAMPAVA